MLTPKEREVLALLAERLSNKQIAAALESAQTAVKWHVKNLFSKLNAASRKPQAASREHAIQRARVLGLLAAR